MYNKTAYFRFYEELNDFLAEKQQKKMFAYYFKGTTTVKDSIEAIGVPHTEIDLILVNGISVGFDCILRHEDRVSVYPVFETFDISPLLRLRPEPLRKPSFILDVHLGKLARIMRMLGFDTAYRNDYEDSEIIDISVKERKIILTRDMGILKNRSVTHGYYLRSTDPNEQISEVLKHFDLFAGINEFNRCIRKSVAGSLPGSIANLHNKFWKCSECGKIYWRGSHYIKMKREVEKFKNKV